MRRSQLVPSHNVSFPARGDEKTVEPAVVATGGAVDLRTVSATSLAPRIHVRSEDRLLPGRDSAGDRRRLRLAAVAAALVIGGVVLMFVTGGLALG